MKPVDALHASGWHAGLELGFAAEDGRTWMAHRRHQGPLVVQRPFYPEGRQLCQVVIVHPPGGIAGGDHLDIDICVNENAQVQLTTPGAGKWYRGFGRDARQNVRLRVAGNGLSEWLPQENIFFDGALAEMSLDVDLAEGAVFCGWDFTCLGRPRSNERFAEGSVRQRTEIRRNGRPVFREQGSIDATATLQAEPTTLAGHCAYGTMLMSGVRPERDLVEAAREVVNTDGNAGVTCVGETLVARWIGDDIESGRALFTRLWAVVRPSYAGKAAVPPRIWST